MKVNDKVKNYIITKEINEGQFCNSYMVTDGTNEYFMKEYRDPTQNSKEFNRFYDNQCILIERLNSMGSVTEKFVDHFVEKKIYFQIKEKLKGINLADYFLTHEDYKERVAVSIILCGTVKSLHLNNIVHQDLKPEQIMLVDDELGKKTKLGYRMILSDFDWSIPDGNMVALMGTMFYKSPEHYKNIQPTFKSDIYTVGIMMYTFLAGPNPFYSDIPADDEQIGKMVLSGKITKQPKEINSDIPDNVNDIILRCLSLNPDDRPELDEIQTTLAGISGGLTGTKAGQIYLKSGKDKLLIYGNKNLGRRDFKIFFPNTMDSEGNSVHMYLEEEKIALSFELESDSTFSIFSKDEQKNYFLLNDKKLSPEKTKIKAGDVLEIFSSSKGKKVCSFTLN